MIKTGFYDFYFDMRDKLSVIRRDAKHAEFFSMAEKRFLSCGYPGK